MAWHFRSRCVRCGGAADVRCVVLGVVAYDEHFVVRWEDRLMHVIAVSPAKPRTTILHEFRCIRSAIGLAVCCRACGIVADVSCARRFRISVAGAGPCMRWRLRVRSSTG
jgi:hypothetical protein